MTETGIPDVPSQKGPDRKAGPAKAVVGGIGVEMALKLNPIIAHWLAVQMPFLGDNLTVELVSFAEATVVAYSVYLTPKHFVESVTDVILFVKGAFAQWRAALNQKE